MTDLDVSLLAKQVDEALDNLQVVINTLPTHREFGALSIQMKQGFEQLAEMQHTNHQAQREFIKQLVEEEMRKYHSKLAAQILSMCETFHHDFEHQLDVVENFFDLVGKFMNDLQHVIVDNMKLFHVSIIDKVTHNMTTIADELKSTQNRSAVLQRDEGCDAISVPPVPPPHPTPDPSNSAVRDGEPDCPQPRRESLEESPLGLDSDRFAGDLPEPEDWPVHP